MRTRPIREEIYQNEIMDVLSKKSNGSSILSSIVERRAKNENYTLLPFERYVMDVYSRIQSLIKCIEDMLHIELFMRRFPDKTFFSEYNFNETHYLEYHAKNAIVQMVSFKDLLLHLTNDLFDFGLKKNSVTNLNFKKNWQAPMRIKLSSFDNEGKLLQLFDDYNLQLEQLKGFRNLHIHEGKFNDGALSEINQYLQLFKVTDSLNEEIEPWMIRRYHFAKWKLKERKKELIKMTQDQRDGMEQSFINFTKMMAGEFWHRLKSKVD